MKILIIEDEPATAKRLEKMLKELLPEARNMGIIDTVEESIEFFQKNTEPDLVFMDIHLADGNSFEIFEKVEISCPVIFTTAYDQYAIKAFKVNSVDYLLKPIKQPELVKSLKKFQKNITPPVLTDYRKIIELLQPRPQAGLKRIMVKIGQSIKVLEINDIAYFFVENKTVYATPKSGSRLPIEFTMDYLENELNSEQFFRVNRSIIISFGAIKSMFAYSKSRIKIILEPPLAEDVITSSERASQFKEWLKGK